MKTFQTTGSSRLLWMANYPSPSFTSFAEKLISKIQRPKTESPVLPLTGFPLTFKKGAPSGLFFRFSKLKAFGLEWFVFLAFGLTNMHELLR